MGYMTKYKLDYTPTPQENIDVRMETLWDGEWNPFEEECKWYEHTEDMKKLSLEFPTTLFSLQGEGEEAGDLWRKFFKNGKMQVCKARITFDKFDAKELK
jgi:hypothetical protein